MKGSSVNRTSQAANHTAAFHPDHSYNVIINTSNVLEWDPFMVCYGHKMEQFVTVG